MEIGEAKATLEADKMRREKECTECIEKTLQEFNCALDVALILTQNGYNFKVNIKAQD